MRSRPVRVLFICTGNVCRSQLAEALLRRFGGERFDVHSAGYVPSAVHPLVIEVLREIGIDAGRQRSKHWNEYLDGPPFDYIITLCDHARLLCPAFPGQGQRLHWPVEDPITAGGTKDEQLAVFRRVRDKIAARLRRFLQSIEPN